MNVLINRKTERKIQAELARRQLDEFVRLMWDTIIHEKLVWNWHMDIICRELQIVAKRVIERKPKKHNLIINIPPGTTKSTICSIMFPAWLWVQDQRLRSICASYSKDLALDFSIKCRFVMESEKYTDFFGKLNLREDLNTKSHYANSMGGERVSTSTGSTIIGRHGHVLIIDDPIDPRGVESPIKNQECNKWHDQQLSTRKVDKAVTPTILIQQRLGINDLTAHLLKKHNDVRHVCLPCDDSWDIKPPILKREYKKRGGLLDPKRLGRPVLREAEEDLGPRIYAGQYGQAPRPREGNMFQTERFIKEKTIESLPAKIEKMVRYWDKAGTEGGTGARTAGVLLAKLQNKQFAVLDCVTGRWSASKREAKILSTAEIDGRSVRVVVEQEPGSGGKESAENTIRNLAGFNARRDFPGKSKELRAEPWSIQVNGCNVYLVVGDQEHPKDWVRDFVNEHTNFPGSMTKDIVDAASGAFADLTGLAKGSKKRAGVW